MNILFVTRFYPDSRIGGIERVTGLLAKFFHEHGSQVYCLHFEKSDFDGSLGNVIHACRRVTASYKFCANLMHYR